MKRQKLQIPTQNRKFIMDQYYNFVMKAFIQLEEAGPAYT